MTEPKLDKHGLETDWQRLRIPADIVVVVLTPRWLPKGWTAIPYKNFHIQINCPDRFLEIEIDLVGTDDKVDWKRDFEGRHWMWKARNDKWFLAGSALAFNDAVGQAMAALRKFKPHTPKIRMEPTRWVRSGQVMRICFGRVKMRKRWTTR